MAIIETKHKKQGFTNVYNGIVKDKRLSLKALGLLVKMLSVNQDDWNFSAKGFAGTTTDGEKSISNAMKELEELGYLKRSIKREKGKFASFDYTIYEESYKSEKADSVKEEDIPTKEEFIDYGMNHVASGTSWDIEFERLKRNGFKDSRGNKIQNWKNYCKALEKNR